MMTAGNSNLSLNCPGAAHASFFLRKRVRKPCIRKLVSTVRTCSYLQSQALVLLTCVFVCRLTCIEEAHGAAEAALLALANLAAHPGAQQQLLEQGALLHVVSLLFRWGHGCQ